MVGVVGVSWCPSGGHGETEDLIRREEEAKRRRANVKTKIKFNKHDRKIDQYITDKYTNKIKSKN